MLHKSYWIHKSIISYNCLEIDYKAAWRVGTMFLNIYIKQPTCKHLIVLKKEKND